MFGVRVEPLRLGRFVILQQLGRGGMGDVYAAYDPQLDRRVALKLLRTTPGKGSSAGARERLQREAVALAQLSHPNVVPVHDVGSIDMPVPGLPGVGDAESEKQLFIVMELVSGRNLRQWLEAEERSWQAIVGAYRQAGAGLAAAHRVGLVHRDFKPANAQVGDDERVRVLDFGLARTTPSHVFQSSNNGSSQRPPGDSPAPVSAPVSTPLAFDVSELQDDMETASLQDELETATSDGELLHAHHTRTGVLLGTPAYMSPEQFSGSKVGPASDQFNFCVALYEALYGVRPFPGTTLRELHANVTSGNRPPPPRASGVPGFLLPILERGLSVAPDERYPTMDALLEDLARDPARLRRRRLHAAAFAVLCVALAGSLGYALSRSSTPADPCAGASERLVGTWDDDRKAAIEGALSAVEHPYASAVVPRVLGTLDAYAATWVSVHESACQAHRRGEQSGELLDRRMACLERHLDLLDSAVSVIAETDATSLDSAVQVAGQLPAPTACSDSEALMAEVAPPADADSARRVNELRNQLSRAQALEYAGRHRDAHRTAQALAVEAAAIGYRPLEAEIALLHGHAAMGIRDWSGAQASLARATRLGLGSEMRDVAVEALARAVYVEGTWANREHVLHRLPLFDGLADALPARNFARALLYNNIGVVSRAHENPEQARAYLNRALDARGDGGRVELAGIGYNLALITDDPARRTELLRGALQAFEDALGKEHPRTLNLRVISAPHVLELDAAYQLLEPACGLYERLHPELRDRRGKCLRLLAHLEAERGHTDAAAAHYATAAELTASADGPFTYIARGHAALYRDDPGAAERAFVTAIAHQEKHLARQSGPTPWWSQRPIGEAALGLGLVHLARGEHAAAVAPLERALTILERATAHTPNITTRQHLARGRAALARALCPVDGRSTSAPTTDTPSPCDRAAALREQARAWYTDGGPSYTHRLRALAP